MVVTRRPATLGVLVAAVLAAAAAPAHAGSYAVNACVSAGSSWDNRAWNGIAAAGIAADEACPRDDAIGNVVSGARTPSPRAPRERRRSPPRRA